MSYAHQLIEVKVAAAASLASLADIGSWGPGLVPVTIRGVALLIGSDIAAAGVVKVDKRPTFGSDTSRGDGDVATINLATTHTGGKVVYSDGLDVDINPGEEVVFEVTDVTGAGDVADLILLVEPRWEVPGNIAAMVATT
jgi:hypothetical protein